MWFTKKQLNSEEYLELLKRIQRLEIGLEGQLLELQLYAKKLKASKGLNKKEVEELAQAEKDSFNNDGDMFI